MKVIKVSTHLYPQHYFTRNFVPELFKYTRKQVLINANNGLYLCNVRRTSEFQVQISIESNDQFIILMKKYMED
jgi:hypothetical protein